MTCGAFGVFGPVQHRLVNSVHPECNNNLWEETFGLNDSTDVLFSGSSIAYACPRQPQQLPHDLLPTR